MDESFFSAELLDEFELADAEYRCDDEMDVATEDELPHRLHSVSDGDGEEDDKDLQANLSVQEVDGAENTLIDGFMVKGCGCSLGPGKSPCSKLLSREEISSTRMNCQEMSSTELDILVLANLDAHSHTGPGYSGASVSPGQRFPIHMSLGNGANVKRQVSIDYYFRGRHVCKATFTYVHAIGPKRFKNLVAHFQEHGLVPRVHGNTKRLPANTITNGKN